MPIDHLIGEYDAVLIATGLQESRIIPIPGADAEGVVGALEFLQGRQLEERRRRQGQARAGGRRRQRRGRLRAGRAARRGDRGRR